MRRPPNQFAVALILATVLISCGDEPASLTVADVEFSERELLGLSTDRRLHLAEITALALAVNRGELLERATALRARAAQRALVRALRTQHLLEAAQVGDDVLAARYELEPEYELEVRHLVVLAERGVPESVREEARQKAAAALERARSGEPFEEVAGETSEEPGAAARGGLLQPAREGMWVDEFWSAALALQPGEISGVVESPFGFHVLRLEDRRVVPFAEARDRVAARVAELVPPQPFDALRDSVSQVIDIDASAQEWADLDESVPLATWNGGSFTVGELRTFLQSEPSAVERGAFGGGSRAGEVVGEAALEAALAAQARGLELAAQEAGIEEDMEDWRVRAEGWAATLGLLGTTDREALAGLALNALGATGQNATVARDALARERGPLLRSLYRIETGGHGGT